MHAKASVKAMSVPLFPAGMKNEAGLAPRDADMEYFIAVRMTTADIKIAHPARDAEECTPVAAMVTAEVRAMDMVTEEVRASAMVTEEVKAMAWAGEWAGNSRLKFFRFRL